MVFNDEVMQLAQQLGQLLAARGQQVTCAESCTGGLIAAAITSVAGSSQWFHGAYVTYDNAVKQSVLGVRPDTLHNEGAVSEATVRQMASGALASLSAHWAISVSGIAGPGGAVPGKPVGTVWFGLAQRLAPDTVRTQAAVRHFGGDRAQVREQSLHFALDWLIRSIGADPVVA
ncbi:MAG: CinA family protein [Pigmentiphaga sp.]